MPDVCPNEVMSGDSSLYDFSMAQGEFRDVFGGTPKAWHCIATCFFIDTAQNLFDYLACINKILMVGGLWVNIGPL